MAEAIRRRTAPEEKPLVLIARARQLLAEASDSITTMKAIEVAKLARHIAKIRGDAVAVGNEALRVELDAWMRLTDEYEAAQERGEVATQADGRPPESVLPKDTYPTTLTDMGLDRRDLSKRRPIRKAGGKPFYDGVIDQATADQVEGTTISVLRAAAAALGTLAKFDDVELPAGKYECIVIDPPWPMEKIERDVAPNQVGFEYPTMDEEALAEFPVAEMAHDDCHLFLWTTHKFLPMALRLADAWGFKYVCTFVWHKPGGFQPYGLPQYNCEFALYCRKGAPKFVDVKDFLTCFNAKRRQHSRKPDEFYEMVARVTDGPRIDVFSREARDGFEQYGNEPGKFAS